MKVQPVQSISARDETDRRLLLEELQSELLRLEARIHHRLEIAFRRYPKFTELHLAYASTVLEIAVAPNPELNLFDMIGFLEVSRQALRAHKFEEKALAGVFDDSIAEVWDIADLVLDEEQKKDLSAFIAQWIENHPEPETTDRLRFSRCPETMKQDLTGADPRGVRRLIQHANQAFQVADAARLLGERTFHYAQRAPSLMRLQTRIGAREIIGDSIRMLKSPLRWGDSLAGRLKRPGSFLRRHKELE